MALTGLDIYKLLPKTNCKDCGFSTCLAFAMALAQKKASLDKCPHVSAQAKEALDSASQPPIKLVTIGTGERKLEMGNETVMYRHEQKFYHPAGIGFLIPDTLSDDDIAARLAKIHALIFERVGQKIEGDLVCIKNCSHDRNSFIRATRAVMAAGTPLNIALYSHDAEAMSEALKLCKDKRPLIMGAEAGRLDSFLKLAKEYSAPLVIAAKSVEEVAQLTDTAKKAGVNDLAIHMSGESLPKRVQDFTFIRRTALKKNARALGYPLVAFTGSDEPDLELAEAISYVLKYASLVVVKNVEKEFVLPLLVARQDVYADPQKPVQVEPKVYEIGKVGKDSPVIATTNFSITYFTVAGEVEASKVPTYIICCDSEGMSVLTAWAAEKFTPEKIAAALKDSGIEATVAHRKVVIPGYVSVMSGKLEEVSGWKVSVGPREASGIPNFLRNYK